MEMMNMSRHQLEARFHPVKDVREETCGAELAPFT